MVNGQPNFDVLSERPREMAEIRRETEKKPTARLETADSLHQKITGIDGRINTSRVSIDETNAKLVQVRERMGIPHQTTEAPGSVITRAETARLEGKKNEFIVQKENLKGSVVDKKELPSRMEDDSRYKALYERDYEENGRGGGGTLSSEQVKARARNRFKREFPEDAAAYENRGRIPEEKPKRLEEDRRYQSLFAQEEYLEREHGFGRREYAEKIAREKFAKAFPEEAQAYQKQAEVDREVSRAEHAQRWQAEGKKREEERQKVVQADAARAKEKADFEEFKARSRAVLGDRSAYADKNLPTSERKVSSEMATNAPQSEKNSATRETYSKLGVKTPDVALVGREKAPAAPEVKSVKEKTSQEKIKGAITNFGRSPESILNQLKDSPTADYSEKKGVVVVMDAFKRLYPNPNQRAERLMQIYQAYKKTEDALRVQYPGRLEENNRVHSGKLTAEGLTKLESQAIMQGVQDKLDIVHPNGSKTRFTQELVFGDLLRVLDDIGYSAV